MFQYPIFTVFTNKCITVIDHTFRLYNSGGEPMASWPNSNDMQKIEFISFFYFSYYIRNSKKL